MFHETRFPTAIARAAHGGPERRTDVIVLGSGAEERNARWADSRRTYNAGYGVKSLDDLHAVIAFFEERRGRLHGFRWRDATDWKSCAPEGSASALDQLIATGDGTTAVFQLTKTYGSAFNPWTRAITKPVAGSARDDAHLVSTIEDRAAYGGTPSDETVIAAIQDLKDRGLEVTLTPFIFMDVPADNVLPDPYTGATGHPPRRALLRRRRPRADHQRRNRLVRGLPGLVPGTRRLGQHAFADGALAWGDPLDEFRTGAVAVLSRTADPALGHAGFLIGETADSIILLGGNQNDAVTVEVFPRTRLLGLRWPSANAASPPSVIPEAEASAEAIGDPAATDALFNRALAHVLEIEGGWTDDPYDPGGPTNFGITLATYARDKGIELTAANMAALKAELKSIPAATVRRIYRERYWLPASCLQMSPALGFFHFDAAVNQGVTGAARLLQEAVSAEIDGEIGPETLARATARPIAETLALYAEARRRHYRSLATFWRFGKGWLIRVDRTLDASRAIAAATGSPPPGGEGLGVGGTPTAEILRPTIPSQPKEQAPMTDTTQPPAATAPAPDSKWWGQSMTIWGVIITTLSTVLPAFGPLLGLDVTAELVRQLGDQIVVIVQAVGGLIGTILTIWGRARATTTLERKQITMNM